MTKNNKRRGLGATLYIPSELEARAAARRQLIRNSKTPRNLLAANTDGLYRLCRQLLAANLYRLSLEMLQQSSDDNKAKLQAWIELPDVFPMDVINEVKKIFEKPGNDWKVEYSFSDSNPTYDHLGFTPPADWIQRLLTV
jgi:hypothetical protein